MVQTKAIYNHFRQDPSLATESWMVEDLRPLPINDCWKRLEKFGVRLDRKAFLKFAEECDTPEDLAELLIDEDVEPAEYDQIYLLLFELWRRFLPERATLSIFCDELDYQIDRYYNNELESDEPIQDGLSNLAEILEEHLDAKMKAKEAFAAVSDYCASDLEVFLYDYIADLLDQENVLYAQELIEEFSPFFQKSLSFELLKARLVNFTDTNEANAKIESILEKKPPIELLFDILRFLVTSGEHELFQTAAKLLLPQLSTKEQFTELAELSAEYYRLLDKEDKEEAILRILKKSSELKTGLRQLQDVILSK